MDTAPSHHRLNNLEAISQSAPRRLGQQLHTFHKVAQLPPFHRWNPLREEVDVQQARCRPPDLAQPQCWEPEQDVQPLTQEPSILHTGPPTEHEGEEGVITQQQHDAQHCPEAVPGCALLQLKQPIVLGDKKTGWVGTHEMPALQSQGRWCQDYDSEQRTGLPTP